MRDAVNRRETSRKWRAAHPEKVKEYRLKYDAAHLEENAEYKRKWRAAHPEAHKEASRKWESAHREERKDALRKWQAAHPGAKQEAYRKWEKSHRDAKKAHNARRRARKTRTVSTLASAEIKAMRASGCFFCGSHDNLAIAHDKPIAKGGNTTRGNTFCLCRSCNSKMGTKRLSEMIMQRSLEI